MCFSVTKVTRQLGVGSIRVLALLTVLSACVVVYAQTPDKASPKTPMQAPSTPSKTPLPKLEEPQVGDDDDGLLKLPKEDTKKDREKTTKRYEFRPVTDWPNRIDLLIRQSQTPMAFRTIVAAGTELTVRERTELSYQALNELAARAETSRVPASSLKQAKDAREKAKQLTDPVIDRAMEAMEERLSVQVIVSDLQSLREFLEKGQWGQAANRAQVRLLQTELPPEVRTLLDAVSRVGRNSHALGLLQAALRGAERGRSVSETADVLRRLDDMDQFSPNLQTLVKRWLALTDLRAAIETPWQKPPAVSALRKSLNNSGLTNEQSDEMSQDLAVKMLLDGFPNEARKMLSESGSASHAEALLRDLTSVILGSGKVERRRFNTR